MSEEPGVRIAIVHDALCVSGGAERLVLWMAKAFPEAPVYTSVYLPANTFAEYRHLDVRVLPFTRFIRSEKQFKLFYPLWLFLIQRLDFKEYDIVLSSSTYLAKYIRPDRTVRHVSYLYAPFRLLWKPDSYSAESLPTPRAASSLVKWLSGWMRNWDIRRTRAIPRIATSCRNMAQEIYKVYGMPSTVLYPPVEIPALLPQEAREEYYLSVSRLISHKRVDLAVQACAQLGRKLVVVGDGPERQRLERLVAPDVRFVGRVSDEALQELYRKAKALIFPSYEDYGIVPLEAQAWGVPVIAFGKGGSLETIQQGISGIFFDHQEVESLVAAIKRFESIQFDPVKIRQWVTQFNVEGFIAGLQEFVSLK